MTDIPDGWAIAQFGDVVRIDSDLVDPGVTPDAPHIAPNHIESRTGRLLEYATVARDGVMSPKHRFRPGQILYSKIRPYLAKAVHVDFSGLCSADMYPLSTDLDARFLHRWILSDSFTARVSQDQGRTVLPKVNQAALKKISVLVPPLNEQRRIADKIEAVFARGRRAKEALDAVPPLLDQLRQSILAAAFRGDLTAAWRAKNPNVEPADKFLARITAERRSRWEAATLAMMTVKGKRPLDDRWKESYPEPDTLEEGGLPALPASWGWISLDAVGAVVGGITKGQKRSADDQLREVPYLRVANVQRGHLDLSEVSTILATPEEIDRLRLVAGDVLLNEGGDRDKLGRGWIWSGEIEECIHQNHVFRARPLDGSLHPKLISWFGNTFGQVFFLDAGKQTTNLASVSLSRVKRLPLPLMPLQEQAELVRCLEERLATVDRLEASLADATDKARVLDRAILGKAFRGELVPQDPDDEPASVVLERIRAARDTGGAAASAAPRRSRKAERVSEATDEDDCGSEVSPPRTDSVSKDLSEIDQAFLQDEVSAALWPLGPFEKDAAVRRVADHLRQAGYVQFQRLRADGPLFGQVLDAIESAVKVGRLDRPKRGHVRACRPDATSYTPDDWRHALVASLPTGPIDRDDAIRTAAEWARDNLGLEFARLRDDGHIVEGLRSAINSAIRRGDVVRHDAKLIFRATVKAT